MTASGAVLHEPDELLLGFCRALRAAGVAVTHDRSANFLAAAARLGIDDAENVRRAAGATLCAGPDDLARLDDVFDAWFLAKEGLPRTAASHPRPQPRTAPLPSSDEAGSGEGEADALHALASDVEVLRHRDVADLTNQEKAVVARLLEEVRPRSPLRRAARRTAWHRGEVDAVRTLRAMLRQHGEPGRVAWRRRGQRARRVVVLIDVSGSMGRYADTLLRVGHRFVQRADAEVFTVGTRLTYLTPALRHRDSERAIAAAGDAVPDWSGGTRLGEVLGAFLDRWGQRGMARGAVVVIFSDGWERGDAAILGEQAARLRRLAHRVIWVNPHRGRAGYEPIQGGIVAVLPHVDQLIAGHSVATYVDLAEEVAHA